MPISKKKSDSNKRRKIIRDKLLAAIVRLAAEGELYSTVSVERLATTAGVSRATFYIYFEGKADLLESWFTDVENELAAASTAWFSLDGSATEADLAAALQAIADVYLSHQPLLAAFNDEATQNTDLRDRFNAGLSRATNDLSAHLQKGQREGWADPDLLPLEISAWLVWTLERGLGNVVAASAPERAQVQMATLASMVWHVLYAGSPAHPAAR
jgi:AcrR family transcriptional regulator